MNLLQIGNERRCLSFLIWQFPTIFCKLLLKFASSKQTGRNISNLSRLLMAFLRWMRLLLHSKGVV